MSRGRPALESEIDRLQEEIAARRSAAAELRDGLEAQRAKFEGLGDLGLGELPPPGAAPPSAPGGDPAAGPGTVTQPASRPATESPGNLAELLAAHVPPDTRPLVLRSGCDLVSSLGTVEPIPYPPPIGGDPSKHAEGGTAAIASLEALRAEGATRLVLPADREEWLRRTPGFLAHLNLRYERLGESDGWAIRSLEFDPALKRPAGHQLQQVLEQHRARHRGELALLDWRSGLGLAGTQIPGCTVFSPPSEGERLPYLDDSVEIVALGAGASAAMRAEARRVALDAVVSPSEPRGPVKHFEVEWLRGPTVQQPSASIVIPTFNGARILEGCLRAIYETLSAAVETQVVVVDDASDDETPSLLRRWARKVDWLEVVRNEANRGFLDSCNAGAAAAGGELLVFLNNDTLPLPGWLLPLVETLTATPDAGAVGGKLLYPDGSLQEAGGVIFSDGGGANLGRGDPNPDRPLYSFVRDVHYCSGALLATQADRFRQLGGFDTEFAPGYYEETDYCFRLRGEGARVLYEPESAIIHLEGATAGTDESTGMKRYQAINREKFRARWKDELAECPQPPAQWDELTWHRLARAGVGKSRP